MRSSKEDEKISVDDIVSFFDSFQCIACYQRQRDGIWATGATKRPRPVKSSGECDHDAAQEAVCRKPGAPTRACLFNVVRKVRRGPSLSVVREATDHFTKGHHYLGHYKRPALTETARGGGFAYASTRDKNSPPRRQTRTNKNA
jgi:hypothetical protein